METKNVSGLAQARPEINPDVPMENTTIQILFNTKIKDLPKDFYAAVTVGEYYMYVHCVYDMAPLIYTEKVEGCGRTTTVRFRDPDPNLTVGELFMRAKALIEASINCARP